MLKKPSFNIHSFAERQRPFVCVLTKEKWFNYSKALKI